MHRRSQHEGLGKSLEVVALAQTLIFSKAIKDALNAGPDMLIHEDTSSGGGSSSSSARDKKQRLDRILIVTPVSDPEGLLHT